ILVEQMESIGSNGVSDEDVKRAVVAISKGREQQFANTERFATALSEWESYGDWRLYFLHRDRLEAVTKADVQEFAKKYMIQSNRTVGLFFPSEETDRIAIDAQNNVKKMVANYKGREAMAAGEAFDPSPMNIQKRTTFGELTSGMKFALLPKETRGDRVTLSGTIHYGDENSLKGKRAAADLLPQLLSRGTKELGFQEYQDALNNLKASLGFSGSLGTLNFNLQTERKNLVPALAIMRQALREPKLDPNDMEIIQSEMVTGIESGMSDPMSLAVNEFSRRMDPQPADNVRYTPTMEEEVKSLKDVNIDDVRNLQEKFLNGQFGEIAVVGDFDPTTTLAELNKVFDGWKTEMPYQRIEEPANLDIKAERVNLDTPDKANAIYIAGVATDINENHPDYEAMLIGNYIMGGGPLSSRIADRVRKQDGLSYTAMTRFQADDQDERGMYMMFCISNPMNTEKVVETVKEEVDRMLESGVTGDELQKAKESFLINRRGGRARDGQLAGELLSNMKTGRTMEFQNASDDRISTLTKEQVDAAMKKVINPDRLLIITAGDFNKAKSESSDK
ncbi:insulinase family protein, partial [Mariniblastus sp.]|nr:insulinase family protein [Mariniblastus sp.]